MDVEGTMNEMREMEKNPRDSFPYSVRGHKPLHQCFSTWGHMYSCGLTGYS